MKFIIIVACLVFLLFPKVDNAEIYIAPPVVPKVWTKPELLELTGFYAQKYGVSKSLMIRIINCEDGSWNPKARSGIIKNGVEEPSFGLVQIHLPSHPDVSLAQATDPHFALNFLAFHLSKGHARMWSCYRFNLI